MEGYAQGINIGWYFQSCLPRNILHTVKFTIFVYSSVSFDKAYNHVTIIPIKI